MTIGQQKRVAEGEYLAYLKSDMDDITKAYRKPSAEKAREFARWKSRCAESGCTDIRVIRKNTYVFTLGYVSADRTEFTYVTPTYSVTITVPLL